MPAKRKAPGRAESPRHGPLLNKASKAYKGTVMCDVRSLTRKWPDATNRDLDSAHVQHLKGVFMAGLYRHLPENHLKLTVSAGEWDEILSFLVHGMKDSLIVSPANTEITKEGLEALAAKNGHGLVLHDPTSGVFWPRKVPAQPVLEAGQHRCAALVELLKGKSRLAGASHCKEKDIHSGIDEEYLWPADVYIRENLSREALFAIRANWQAVSKTDSNGDFLVRLASLIEAKPPKDQASLLKPRVLKEFIINAFGYDTSQIGRILGILRNDILLPLFLAYCRTRYGAENVTITWAAKVAIGSFDFIWVEILEKTIKMGQGLFKDKVDTVSCQDWLQLMDLPFPRRETTLTTLRRFFFPASSDIEDGSSKPKPLQLSPRQVGTATVKTRRAGFLETLNNDEYCAAYMFLIDHPDAALMTYQQLNRQESKTQKILSGLMHHILIWFKNDWAFPQKADSRRKAWQWSREFRDVVLIESSLVENGQRGFGASMDLMEVSENVLRALWKEVDENTAWNEKTLAASVMSGAKSCLGPEAPDKEQREYLSRFNSQHWRAILKIVLDASGPALQGGMAQFNETFVLDGTNLENSGRLTTGEYWGSNQDILKNPFLSDLGFRDKFKEEMNIFGLHLCYRRIKEVLVATLDHGYACVVNKSRPQNADYINDEVQWRFMIKELKQSGDRLTAAGKRVDIDNINEFRDGAEKLGLLSQIPSVPEPQNDDKVLAARIEDNPRSSDSESEFSEEEPAIKREESSGSSEYESESSDSSEDEPAMKKESSSEDEW